MVQSNSHNNYNEPPTPMGRLCLLPEHGHVIHCAIGLKNPINIHTLKHHFFNSLLSKLPRFTSLFVSDPRDGSERWEQTLVNIDNHIFIHVDNDYKHDATLLDDDDIINSYLADMAILPPMSLDKPLWELHVMLEQKCLIMRVHHALADGMSIMSLMHAMGRTHDDDDHNNSHHVLDDGKRSSGSYYHGWMKSLKKMGLWKGLLFIWYSVVFGLKFIARCLWVKDEIKVISGIEGVELWPRKVATAKFKIDDMKAIKKAIPSATIHDVLYGIVWCGLTRYLNAHYPQAVPNGAQITCMCPMNLREQAGLQDLSTMLRKGSGNRWGNVFSVILLPLIHYDKRCELDPLTYVARAKAIMSQKKHSAEARFSYNVVKLATELFGSKVAGFFYYKLFCNTTFLLSNMAGPLEEISIGGNPVTFIRVTSSTQPQAITMHMVSYAGRAELQIQVAKDVIPEPNVLAKCFEDALHEMKEDVNSIVQVN